MQNKLDTETYAKTQLVTKISSLTSENTYLKNEMLNIDANNDKHHHGIRKAKQALQYLVLVKETLGAAWLTPNYFRIGASSLTNDLLMQITKQQSGTYQSPEYFSND